jgi:heptosyltransferase-2
MGFATSGRGALLSRAIPASESSRHRHQLENYRALATLEGEPSAGDSPAVSLDPTWVAEAEALWPLGQRARVAIHPGASYGEAKRWSPRRFGEVARLFLEEGFSVALLGGAAEAELARSVKEHSSSGMADLVGRTGLGVLAAILKSAHLLVTNDSGPMHLAAACGTPVAAIFGSTSPTWTAPWGQHHRVIQERVPCSPCFQRSCRFGAPCLERVTVGRVFRESLEMLERWS